MIYCNSIICKIIIELNSEYISIGTFLEYCELMFPIVNEATVQYGEVRFGPPKTEDILPILASTKEGDRRQVWC